MLRSALVALLLMVVNLPGGASAGQIDGSLAWMARDTAETFDGMGLLQLVQNRPGGGFSAPRITPTFNNSARGMAPRAPVRNWGTTGGALGSGAGITNQVRRWATAPGSSLSAAPVPGNRWGAASGWKSAPGALAPRFAASAAPAPAVQTAPAVRRAFAGAAARPANPPANTRTTAATPLSSAFAGAVAAKATGSAMVRASAPKPVLAPKGPLRAIVDRAAHAAGLAADRLAARSTVVVVAAKPRFDAARDRLRTVFAVAARPTLGQTFRAAAAPITGKQAAARLALRSKMTGGTGGPPSGSPAPKRLTPIFNAAATDSLNNRVKAVGERLRAAAAGLRLDSRVRGHPVLARGAQAFDLVDSRFRQEVRDSFQGPVVAHRLSRPMVVHRIYGGEAGRQGSYFSRFSYRDVLRAARKLALPSANNLSRKSAYILPAGTVVLVGKAASKAGTPGFPDTATGGGEQIVVTDRGRPFALDFAAESLR